jgi:hypothetical protein
MTDLLTAAHNAVIAALKAPTLTALGPVFSNVPEKQQPPFTALGAIDAQPADGDTKDEVLELITVEVEYQYRGASKLPLLAMMHAGRTALETASLIAPGAELATAEWRGSATDREDDGVTYHGVQRFELLAQPT